MLLLREILNRLDLPPDAQVPGDDEVSGGDVSAWTIPDTDISRIRTA